MKESTTRRPAALARGLAVLLSAAMLACTDAGGTPDEAPAAGHEGPNATALAFIEAIREADVEKVRDLSTGPMREFYDVLVRVGEINGKILSFMEKRYPDADKAERRSLRRFRTSWKQPMLFLQNIKLEGKLSEGQTVQRKVYQYSYEKRSVRVFDELEVVRVDGEWRVARMGETTPEGPVLGVQKTVLHRLERTFEAALEAVRKQAPASLDLAVALFEKTSRELAE